MAGMRMGSTPRHAWTRLLHWNSRNRMSRKVEVQPQVVPVVLGCDFVVAQPLAAIRKVGSAVRSQVEVRLGLPPATDVVDRAVRAFVLPFLRPAGLVLR